MPVIELRITVNASFDSTDQLIMNILRRFPSRTLKIHSILNLMEYEGVFMNYKQLGDRLRRLVILGIVCRHKDKRTDRYSISPEYLNNGE